MPRTNWNALKGARDMSEQHELTADEVRELRRQRDLERQNQRSAAINEKLERRREALEAERNASPEPPPASTLTPSTD